MSTVKYIIYDVDVADGYGFCHVPTVPGIHKVECVTWKPTGNFKDQFTCEFLQFLLCIN